MNMNADPQVLLIAHTMPCFMRPWPCWLQLVNLRQSILALFRSLIKKNIFPKEMSRMLHEAFETRQEGDCQNLAKIDREKAAEVLKDAEEFLKVIEEKLSQDQ